MAKSKRKSAAALPPMRLNEIKRFIKPRAPKASKRALVIRIASAVLPAGYRPTTRTSKRGGVEIVVSTKSVGVHAFPPDIKVASLPRPSRGKLKTYDNPGLLPDHLALRPVPQPLERRLVVRRRFGPPDRTKLRHGYHLPTTIFGADDRFTFNDTAFPWCTCGKVETEAGWGSGVMIGPRHMMTASHVIVWKPNNTAGWVKFTPLKFDNSEPFGHSFASLIYSWNKADPSDLLDLTEGAFDYVVCVLGDRMGDATGWMGSRGYNTSWDGGNYWGHIGYPSDLSGGTRPSFIGYQSFTNEASASLNGRSSFRINHKLDVIPGQSGGPYFGWWSGEPWPRVVSIQSGASPTTNSCGGGDPLSEIINFARNAQP